LSDDKSYTDMTNDELFDQLIKCFKCDSLPTCPVSKLRASVIMHILHNSGMSHDEFKDRLDALQKEIFGTKIEIH